MNDSLITIDKITDVEKHLDGIEAVIFDLDDTLYPEKEYVKSGFRKISEQFNMPELEAELLQAFERGGKPIDDVFNARGIINLKDEALHVYRFQKPAIRLFDGVEGMLKRLYKSYKIGIITDGRPEGQHAKIDALGLESKVDEIIITDELGGIEYRKPNPAAFILMQKKLGTPFEKMIYVGDNPKKDFQALGSLKMKSIYFANINGIFKCSWNAYVYAKEANRNKE